jgi:hypothetical protein
MTKLDELLSQMPQLEALKHVIYRPTALNRARVGRLIRETARNPFNRPRDKLRRLVKEVILELYPSGPPASMKIAAIIEDVNERLVTTRRWPHPVAGVTVRRALRELARVQY